MLALDIELLTGAYRAELPDKSDAEWPPHPERVFSALVQAWGDGGCDPNERAALEWLEGQSPPAIQADALDAISFRTAPRVYVPPNDLRGDEIKAIPERRTRAERWFRAVVPGSPLVRMVWTSRPESEHRAALEALALRVASLGHSSSLARFAFVEGADCDPARSWRPDRDAGGGIPLRVTSKGRLSNLERRFDVTGDGRRQRPDVDHWQAYREPGALSKEAPPQSVFGGGSDWIVFHGLASDELADRNVEDKYGSAPAQFTPDLLAFAKVAKAARDAIMAAWQGRNPGKSVPAEISGHERGGSPLKSPHLAIAPLAYVGSRYSDGDLMGFAVLLPRGLVGPERRSVLDAIAAFAQLDRGPDAVARVALAKDKVWWVKRTASPELWSLKPQRYCRPSRTWASVTPILLDRFPDDLSEEARFLAAACRNIGLPEPLEIEIHKHSAHIGALGAYPARGARNRPDWGFPAGSPMSTKARRHAIFHFENDVEGPVIVGAGRFYGLGLCAPFAEKGA